MVSVESTLFIVFIFLILSVGNTPIIFTEGKCQLVLFLLLLLKLQLLGLFIIVVNTISTAMLLAKSVFVISVF